MFLKFTNATKGFEGQSITINMNRITSIFEKKVSDETPVTVLYSGPNEFWEVKESYLLVMARVSAE